MASERRFFERLKALDKHAVKAKLKPYLTGTEMTRLLQRRKHLIEHIESMIEDRGEDQVLFSLD